ncbi:unnamed protein product [Effrenium voratum]|nr:unnamed protein product [Effrenium voratum]
MSLIHVALISAAAGRGTLDWLDCRGPPFAASWAELQAALAVQLKHTPDLLSFVQPLHPVIVKYAEDLEPVCQARKDVAALLAWTGQTHQSDYEAMGSLRWWINSSYQVGHSQEDGFCLYGCVAVLFLLAFNELAWLSVTPTEPTEAQAEKSLQYIFVSLHYARSLLGDHSTLDLISTSSWPAHLSSAITDLFVKAEALVTGPTLPVEKTTWSSLELARAWQPCDPLLHQGCFTHPGGAVKHQRANGAPLVMLLLGEHAPFANTVWLCVQSAAIALSMSLRPIFVGTFYGCKGLPSGCENDAAKDWFRAWMKRWPMSEGDALQVGDIGKEAASLVHAIHQHPDPDAGRPDFILCGDTVLFCWLLRQAQMFRHVPALHMYGMVFLQYVPFAWRRHMLQDFGHWWTQERDDSQPAGVQIEVLSLQLQWQMGIALPFVPSAGTSDAAGVLYQSKPGQRSVLVLKSGFFALAPGQVFSVVLRRLGDESGIRWNHWGFESREFLSFAAMASHSCALYVAPEFSQLLLRDVYGIGLPMFAPTFAWHLRLLQHMFASWGQLHTEHDIGRRWEDKLEQKEGPGIFQADLWPFGPFYNPAEHTPEHLAFWMPLAEVHRYPHMLYFASLTELLHSIETVDLGLQSLRMQEQNRIIAANVRRFYRQALQQMLR